VVALYHKKPDAFHKDQTVILQNVALKLAPWLAASWAFGASRSLPAEPVARDFFAKADATIRDGSPQPGSLTLGLVEVQRYAEVSARIGAAAAEYALSEFASQMPALLGMPECTGTLGQGEFAVLLRRNGGDTLASWVEQAAANLTRIGCEVFADPFVRVVVGAAALGEDGSSLEELMAVAEGRLQAARKLSSPPEGSYELSLRALCEAASGEISAATPVRS
jgi:GGDEF domain-containing protein